MVSLFCYFLPMLLGNQSLITCLISMREEPVFLSFFRLVLSPCSPDSVSLGQSVLFGLLLSKGRTFLFFFFTRFYLSCVVSLIWAVVISKQNFSFFFTRFCLSWVVSPIWAVVISRQNLSFFSFHLALSLLGSLFILDSFLSYNELIFRMNLSKIKFTCLDYSYLFLYRFNSTLTMKSRDEKAIFFLVKKLVLLLR